MTSVTSPARSGSVDGMIQVDEAQVRSHLDQLVRQSVEDTLNALLEAEADSLCGAKRYERSVERLDTRAGHYDRTLTTTAGQVCVAATTGSAAGAISGTTSRLIAPSRPSGMVSPVASSPGSHAGELSRVPHVPHPTGSKNA